MKKSEKEIKRLVLIANSGYATHKDYTVEEWFYASDWLRKNPKYKVKL